MTSWVTVDLDTRPPDLSLAAQPRVNPPDTWVVLVTADEALGSAEATFTDALGAVVRPGVERLSSHLVALSLPTVGLASGPGVLRLTARDTACNATTVLAEVVVDRARAFDVVLTFGHALAADLTVTGAYGLGLDVEHALEATLGQDGAYEATLAAMAAYVVTLGQDGAHEASLTTGAAYEVALTPDHSHQATVALVPIYAVTLEISHDPALP